MGKLCSFLAIYNCTVFHFHLMYVAFSGGIYGMPPLVDRYGLGLPIAHAAMVRRKESLLLIGFTFMILVASCTVMFLDEYPLRSFQLKFHRYLICFALVSLIHFRS